MAATILYHRPVHVSRYLVLVMLVWCSNIVDCQKHKLPAAEDNAGVLSSDDFEVTIETPRAGEKLTVGKDLILRCIANRKDIETYTWHFRQYESIPKPVVVGTGSMFSKRRVKSSDAGLYTCVATTSSWQRKARNTVRVKILKDRSWRWRLPETRYVDVSPFAKVSTITKIRSLRRGVFDVDPIARKATITKVRNLRRGVFDVNPIARKATINKDRLRTLHRSVHQTNPINKESIIAKVRSSHRAVRQTGYNVIGDVGPIAKESTITKIRSLRRGVFYVNPIARESTINKDKVHPGVRQTKPRESTITKVRSLLRGVFDVNPTARKATINKVRSSHRAVRQTGYNIMGDIERFAGDTVPLDDSGDEIEVVDSIDNVEDYDEDLDNEDKNVDDDDEDKGQAGLQMSSAVTIGIVVAVVVSLMAIIVYIACRIYPTTVEGGSNSNIVLFSEIHAGPQHPHGHGHEHVLEHVHVPEDEHATKLEPGHGQDQEQEQGQKEEKE